MFVNDIQWAEAVFLDLLASMPALVGDVALLVLALARPELLDARSDWDSTSAVVRLEPLAGDAVSALLEELAGGALPNAVARHVVQASGGNALFAEELMGELLEGGALRRAGDGWTLAVEVGELTVPSSIDALLGSRLDRLPVAEQDTLERASVEGDVFHLGAVQVLTGTAADESARAVMALTERAIVAETDPDLADERAFRFRRLLIRDAAYRRLPKAARASLHQEFAAWLEERAGDGAAEYEEVLGYHLELAHALRIELGRRDDETARLGERAAALLTSSGRIALGRGDIPAAGSLLRRALALTPEASPARAGCWWTWRRFRASRATSRRPPRPWRRSRRWATSASTPSRRSAGCCSFSSRWRRSISARSGSGSSEPTTRSRATSSRWPECPADWRGWTSSTPGRFDDRQSRARARHARRSGSAREVNDTMYLLPMTTVFGPVPRTEGVARCEEWLRASEPVSKVRALTLCALGCLAMLGGRFDEARALVNAGVRMLHDDLGMRTLASALTFKGEVAAYAGNYAEAESIFAAACQESLQHGAPNPTVECNLATAVLEQGRTAEALAAAERVTQADVARDPDARVRWHAVRARAHARLGDVGAAERLAAAALDAAEAIDMWDDQAIALRAAAEVHDRPGAAPRRAPTWNVPSSCAHGRATRSSRDGCGRGSQSSAAAHAGPDAAGPLVTAGGTGRRGPGGASATRAGASVSLHRRV